MQKFSYLILIVTVFTNSLTAQNKQAKYFTNAFPNLLFENPIDLTTIKDNPNKLFIAEKKGIISLVLNESATKTKQAVLDIREKVYDSGECGLLGITFSPDFNKNGYLYVNYTSKSPIRTIIARYTVDDKKKMIASNKSELILLDIDQPYSNHNGGQIAFGPDGFLYIGMGDGGSAGDPLNNSQNLNSLLGKMLRIDVNNAEKNKNYSIPNSNPFKGTKQQFREEIYAYGLRNPWRFNFDTKTGDLWCADVGQNQWEEIDIITSGANYGWNVLEANHPFKDDFKIKLKFTAPLFEYNHSKGDCSITGGFVYHGSIRKDLEGYYIYGDYCSRKIWAFNKLTQNNKFLFELDAAPLSFGIDENNELFILASDGIIYKFN